MKNKIFSVFSISLLMSSQIASANPAGIVAATLAVFGLGVSSAPTEQSPTNADGTKTFHKDTYNQGAFKKTFQQVERAARSAPGNGTNAHTAADLVCPSGQDVYCQDICTAVSSVCSQDCVEVCDDVCQAWNGYDECIIWDTICYENCGPVNCPCIETATSCTCRTHHSSCFSSRNFVHVKNADGTITVKSMNQLAVGDLVEVSPSQFAKVTTFNHRQGKTAPKGATLARQETAFVTLHAGDAQIELTADHFLYRDNSGTPEMVLAGDIKVGDRLVSQDGSDLGSQVVTQIETNFKAVDFYAPITEGIGTIMIYSSADAKAAGIMASVFSGKDVKALTHLYAKTKAKLEAATDAAGITVRTGIEEYGNRPFQDAVSNFVQMIMAQ